MTCPLSPRLMTEEALFCSQCLPPPLCFSRLLAKEAPFCSQCLPPQCPPSCLEAKEALFCSQSLPPPCLSRLVAKHTEINTSLSIILYVHKIFELGLLGARRGWRRVKEICSPSLLSGNAGNSCRFVLHVLDDMSCFSTSCDNRGFILLSMFSFCFRSLSPVCKKKKKNHKKKIYHYICNKKFEIVDL